MRTYVAFDLGLSLGEVSNVSFRSSVSDPPDDVFTWRVVCDDGAVTITTREKGKVVEVGRATWSKRQLIQRAGKADGYPNDYQWELVEKALRGFDAAGAPRGRPAAAPAPRRRERNARISVLIRAAAPVVALAVVVVMVVRRTGEQHTTTTPSRVPAKPAVTSSPPARPPAPEPLEVRVAKAASFDDALALARPAMETPGSASGELLARYAAPRLRWDDVATASTSIGFVLKDVGAERGKRLCATGTLQAIERGDLEGRAVYRGALRTDEGDEIGFLAVGSTGALVRRDKSTICGVVLGKTGDTVGLLGMFDLPENRSPAVEREVP